MPTIWKFYLRVWLGLALLAALPAFAADVAPAKNWGNPAAGLASYRMCSAQTTTGVCQSGSDNIVLNVRSLGVPPTCITFDAATLSTGNYTCQVYQNGAGYDADAADKFVYGPSFDQTDGGITVCGAPFYFLWVECDPVATSVTIDALIMPLFPSE